MDRKYNQSYQDCRRLAGILTKEITKDRLEKICKEQEEIEKILQENNILDENDQGRTMITTHNIEQHKTLIDEFSKHPMFEAFETYVDYMLKEKDIEIISLHKKIDECVKEINQINLILKLSEKV